ncbi:MAG: hypothetical protein RR444_01805 [Oscillospiraceae bacterium]
MKSLEVKVCVCTHCVMNGAMDIVESIESLQKLKTQLRFNTAVKVLANECLCDKMEHGDCSPLVYVNGEVLANATSETVTAKIISIIAKG